MPAFMPFRAVTHPPARVRALARLASRHPLRALALADALFLLLFGVLFVRLWRLLPGEGVKLHGNIDAGVDLYGPKPDLLWLPGMVFVLLAGNALLARWARVRGEPLATWFLLGITVPILAGAIGAVLFLSFLNTTP